MLRSNRVNPTSSGVGKILEKNLEMKSLSAGPLLALSGSLKSLNLPLEAWNLVRVDVLIQPVGPVKEIMNTGSIDIVAKKMTWAAQQIGRFQS